MKLRLFPDRDTFLKLAEQGNLVPVCLEILADTETPVAALAKFSRGPGPVFLLESVEGGERWGRYSFLGASARSEIKVFAENVEVTGDGETQIRPHQGDPLACLRQLMARYRPVSLPELPRFWGGMVGYLGYEMVSFFERIPHRLPPSKPLAHFIISDEMLIFDNVRHSLSLLVHVFLDGRESARSAYDHARQRLERMQARLQEPVAAPEPGNAATGTAHLAPMVAPHTFRDMVARIKHHIRRGDVIQTVISQPFTLDNPPDSWNLYRAQRYINPSPYMYYLKLDGLTLVGSSPETMVRLENRVATLRPIAGTRPRGGSEQQDRQLADDLLKDPKERAEHLMLVDLGRNDLGRVAEVGTVQVTDLMVVERYSHVMHLVSNITCDVEAGNDAWDLLKATFPAGTLSGAPKVRAMELIAELEETPRGPYGGAIGYVSFTGNMDLAITIRTATIENNRLTVQAGAGIVADSDPERERVETLNKAMAMERAIELAAGRNR